MVHGTGSQWLAAGFWGSPKDSARGLVCGARSWALWYTGPGPGVPVVSGGLKATNLLVGSAVSLSSYLLDLRHPSTDADKLVGGAGSRY